MLVGPMRCSSDKVEWYKRYKEDGEWEEDWEEISLSQNGISATDLMIVRFDGTAGTISVNGHSESCTLFSTMAGNFFSSYERDYDEGLDTVYSGTIEGTKLYYIVVRDSSDTVIQEGYADKAENPETGNMEYCWCWRAADGTKTYHFAHKAGTYGAYEGYGL